MQKTLRIAYVSNAAIPSNRANSISIMKFCSALAKNGHEVFLIHPHAPWFEEKTNATPFEFYGVSKHFKIIKIAWFPFCNKMSKGILKPIAFLIKTIFYPLLASLVAAKLRPDIIYTRYLPASFWAAYIKNIPTIYEHHDFFREIPFFPRKMLPLMIRKGCLKRLVVISKPLAEDYRNRLPFDPRHIIVAPDGADENLAQPDKNLLQGNFSFNVGFAGHIYPGRGMEIIAKLAENMPDIAFHIIGGANQDISYWKHKCSTLKNIFFYGFVPPSKVPAYLKSVDVLLAPYQRKVSTVAGIDSSNRMSPLKIFEYMASGKPFIA
ncbi:MAG: glycosyltransferase, partial [Candidatus Nanoarchaeia archaeon]